MKSFHLLFVCAILSLLLTSCKESAIVPGEKITVAGQVGNGYNPISNFTVEIQGKQAVTDSEGKFVIQDVQTPYDAIVCYAPNIGFINVYKDLNSTDPFFDIGNNIHPSNYGDNQATLNAVMPPLNQNQIVMSYFIPDDNQGEIYSTMNFDTTARCYFQWYDSPVIRGKWIIFVYTHEPSGFISWDRYYEKPDVSVAANSTLYDTIHPQDPYIDPSEDHIMGNVISPYGSSQSIQTILYLQFPNTINNLIWSVGNSQHFDYTIPGDINQNISYLLEASNSSVPLSKEIERVYPGMNSINLERAVDLISPGENDSISFYNTSFNWTSGEGDGIYVLNLSAANYPLVKIFTSSTDCTIPDISNFLSLTTKEEFRWHITKYLNYSSMNHYVDKENLYKDYRGYTISEIKNFIAH